MHFAHPKVLFVWIFGIVAISPWIVWDMIQWDTKKNIDTGEWTRAIAPLTSLGIFTSLAFMTKITFYHYIMFYDTITCYHLSLLSITRYLFHLTPLTFLLQKISPIKWSQSLIIWELHEMDARARLQCQAMHSFAISHFQLIDSLLKLPPCNYQVWISCLQFLLTGKKMSV